MSEKQFVHLHVHTDYSALDGASKIGSLVDEVHRLGQPAVAITDHGNAQGAYELWKKATEKGINPIVGQEFYVAPGGSSRHGRERIFFGETRGEDKIERSNDVSGGGAYTHMTMWAETTEGMHNLFKLSSYAFLEGRFGSNHAPRIDDELISQYGKGIIATTGCPSGEIQTRLRLGQWKEAVDYAAKMQDILGKENYFLELMDHGLHIEKIVRDDLLKLSDYLNIPKVATNDTHYTRREDAANHDHMLCIQTGSKIDDEKRFRFDGDGYYIKSAQEMRELFKDFPDACDNTLAIAERCHVDFTEGVDLMPKAEVPEGMTDSEFLEQEVIRLMPQRVKGWNKLPEEKKEEYKKRGIYECSIISQMGFPSYFLVVGDFVQWAKNQGIAVGPGRGSAGGCLVAYIMSITDIDPIKHNLIFERFLNPERVSMPDIDIDFDDKRRGEVIAYVTEKYGEDKVSQIVTFGLIKAKAALKDASRILDNPYALGDILSKKMPEMVMGRTMTLKGVYDPEDVRYPEAQEFRDIVEKGTGAFPAATMKEVVEVARGLEGYIRQTGIHAAGVIMSSKPLMDTIPLMLPKPKPQSKKKKTEEEEGDEIQNIITTVTQFDYPTCETLGLLKMDFLGLRNLTIITDAFEYINKNHGITMTMEDLIHSNLDDKKTYELLQRGDTLGVFQLDGSGMRSLLRSLRPTEFNDISAVLALYRPGPMGVNAHMDYADRKNGRQPVTPIHPELEDALEDILGETYGLCVAGDTLVWDAKANSPVRIDQIGDKVSEGNFHTYSMNEETGLIEEKPVSHWFHTGKKPIYEITSKDGRTLKVSGEHPVLTIEGYKKASELTREDYIATPGQNFGDEGENALSIEEARLLGYMIGDGRVTFYQNIFINSDPNLIDHVADLAEGLFDDVFPYPIDRYRDEQAKQDYFTTHLYFGANPQGTGRGRGVKGVYRTTFKMNKWLEEMFGRKEGINSRTKFVPPQMFASSRETILHFLAGLWDTDGHVNPKSTYLKTISKDLAYGVQSILDKVGMHGYVYKTGSYENAKHGFTQSYGVHVFDRDFYDEVLPLMKTEKKRSVKFKSDRPHRHDRIVALRPLLKDMVDPLVSEGVLSKRAHNNMNRNGFPSKYSVMSYMKRNHDISDVVFNAGKNHSTRNGFVDAYIEHYAGPENKKNSELAWTRINDIEILPPEDVYDITVEDNHNFLANGVVVHNCIYQEEIMQIAQKVAGYSLGQADLLRRAMGKKKKEEMDKQSAVFSGGMKKRGYSTDAFDALWSVLLPFADYAFNKSHSAGYALLSYVTAYLKAHYPAEYMAALLTSVSDKPDQTALYLNECRKMGIEVLPPDIRKSKRNYDPQGKQIVFGLGSIRGLGEGTVEGIVETRKTSDYDSIASLLENFPADTLNKKVFDGLIHSGALDGYGFSRRALEKDLIASLPAAKTLREEKEEGSMSLFDAYEVETPDIVINDVPEYTKREKLALERHMLGLYVSDHPLSNMGGVLEQSAQKTIAEIHAGDYTEGETTRIAGVITQVENKTTKKGDPMQIVTVEDMSSEMTVLVFAKTIQSAGYLQRDTICQISGTLRKRDDEDTTMMVSAFSEIEIDEATGKVPFWLKFRAEQLDEESATELQSIFKRYPGDTPVFTSLKSPDGRIVNMRLGNDLLVRKNPAMAQLIMEMFGSTVFGKWNS